MITHEVNYFSPKAKPEPVTGTAPAAGAEISETVPDGEVWELHAITVSFVTDATAATRSVRFLFDDGTTVYDAAITSTNHTASTSHIYTFTAGQTAVVMGGDRSMNPMRRGVVLNSGHRIRTVTANIQASDTYGAPVLCVVKGTNS